MKQLLAFAAIVIAITSCNTKYEKTASGLAYKIVKGDSKTPLKAGQIVKINGIVKIAGKDTTLFTTYGHLPEYLPVDTSSRKSHDFNEVLRLCSVGDSLIVVAQVDTLVKMGIAQYNNILKRGDQIETRIRILGVFNSEQEKIADQQKEVEKQKKLEIAELEAYMKKHNIKAEKTENGVFVQITNPGEGAKAAANNKVTVKYTGSVLATGKVFDSNVDTSFHHPQPFDFVVGTGSVIRGWDEAIGKLGKGGKGTFYIPSLMAYGPPGQGQDIPPYASLKFDIEVINIDTAPPAAKPQMPQMSAEDIQRLMQQQQQQQQQAPPKKN